MSRILRRRWTGDHSGRSRGDSRDCEYEAYLPDPLVGRAFTLAGDVAADVSDADTAIARLNAEATALVNIEALARLLLRAESVASSRIEGLEVGARRLLRLEAARSLGESTPHFTATEVLGNIAAMAFSVASIGPGDAITVPLILETHRLLMAGSPLARHGGRFREGQNWIGGRALNPCAAAFVPPPPDHVPALMDDLVSFANEDSLPPVAQAAVAHAQFETIRPFADGNGRTGRALIHLILRRRAVIPRVVPPISLVLATWTQDYVDGLSATRYRGSADSRAAHDGINLWIARFAAACARAADDAMAFEHRARTIEEDWRRRLGRVQARSAVDLLLGALVGAPVLTVTSAAELIGRSFAQTNQAVTRLVDAGILRQISVGRRNRAFEAKDIIDAFTDLERRLASPGGDTRSSEPARAVPQRRRR